ncbi:MAG: CotH kinase family protein [Bacteroidota bacterium]
MRITAVFFTLFLAIQGSAQLPEWGMAFLQDEVATMHVSIDMDTLSALEDPANWGNSHEFPCNLVYSTATGFSGYSQVGIRLRGNTSLAAEKKSFKLKFDAFTPQSFYGLKEVNLIANQNDPSLLRAKLCWDFFREAGIPGARVSYVRLYINDLYAGLYVNVEQIDETFADTYFDDGSENLWKCLWGSDLAFQGTSPNAYADDNYNLIENEDQQDFSVLANFVSKLNQTSLINLPCEIERIFNVHDYLKIMAVDVLIGNWDGYIFNKNNYYLYQNENTGLLEYIPYDLDNTLGIDWVGIDWGSRAVYSWNGNSTRPLFTRLLQVPGYRNEFTNYLYELQSLYFNSPQISQRALNFQDLIATAAIEDPFRELDFGFTSNDFLNAIDSAWGNHVDYGIAEYVDTRWNTAVVQLDDVQPYVSIHNVRGQLQNDSLLVTYLANTLPSEHTVVYRNILTNVWNTLPTSIEIGPGPLNEKKYFSSILLPTDSVNIVVGVIPNTWRNSIDDHDCNFRYVFGQLSSSAIVLNEIAPQGTLNASDADGNSDWIELYNAGTTAVNLKSKFISDDISNPNKWRLPDVTLDPGDYYLLWADDQYEQGVNHLGFKLNNTTEEVSLAEFQSYAIRYIDSTHYENIVFNETWGRYSDGELPWIEFSNTTPDASNLYITVEELETQEVRAYPNPTQNRLHFSEKLSGSICDINGREIQKFQNECSLNLQDLPEGVYLIRTEKYQFKVLKF